MILKKIILENIRSYEKQEIVFPEGSTLLSGDIGSGKTSILLAIEFALFGLQPGQRGTALLRNQETEGKVTIEFEVDGKNILVERCLKRSKTVSQNYCAITINNEKKELSVVELKNKILELLNYPKEFSKKQNILYKFTVYTPQEEMKQIILQDSETRINTLRHVFGIDKYKKILENISILTIKLREEKRIKEALTANIEQDKSNLFSKEKELEKIRQDLIVIEKEFFIRQENRKKIEQEKQELSKKREEKLRLQKEIEKTQILMSTKKESISDNNKLVEQLKNQIKELQDLQYDGSKTPIIEKECGELKKQKETLDRQKLDVSSQINSLNYKNEDNKKLEQKFSNLESCPTCLQDVDAVYRANVLNKIHSDTFKNNQEIEKLEDEKKIILKKESEVDFSLSSKNKELQELNILKIKYQNIEEKQNRFDDLAKINLSLNKDIEMLTQQIGLLKSSIIELNRYDPLFDEKQKEFEEASKQERLADIKLAELKKEIGFFSTQIDELRNNLKKTEEIKKQLDYIAKLEEWLSKEFTLTISHVEKNVMVRLKTEFSKLFAEWFCMLVPGFFNVWLDDDFTPIIEQHDYQIDYAYLSGGERTAVALAYRLALNQVINSLMSKIKTRDIVILDEPTDGFSEQQLDKMRDVLQELNVKQLIIVSHEQKIEGFVENVLKFKKEAGISKRETEPKTL